MLHISSHTFNGCNAYRDSLPTYLKVPTQSRQRNTLPSSIMWKVPITWRAALARPGRVKLAHVLRLGRAFLPRSIANVSPACTMMAHRRTLTPRCTLGMYLPTVQLLRPSSPTHPSRRHRYITIGLTTSTGGSPSAANIRVNPHSPPKCLLTSGGHSVHTDSARFLSTGSSPRNASTRGHC